MYKKKNFFSVFNLNKKTKKTGIMVLVFFLLLNKLSHFIINKEIIEFEFFISSKP
jgi:hypothetical protein